MTDLTPLTLDPVVVPKPWGGRRLEAYGKSLPGDRNYGESWEVADLPVDSVSTSVLSRSRIGTGVHAGMTLRMLIEVHGSDVLGSARATPAGDFPLLLKLLDAREPLSVQVHPTDAYVATHDEGSRSKTESWFIVDAEPSSIIYQGFKPDVSIDEVRHNAGRRGFVELLERVPVVPGEFHHLPAGTIHAVGAGVLIAECQTPSDTTFRMYDWAEESGRDSRILHLEEGLETLDMAPTGAIALGPMEHHGTRLLVASDHYWQREHKINDGHIQLLPGQELRILMVVRGTSTVTGPDTVATEMTSGTTVLLPAAIADDVVVEAVGEVTMLEIGLV